LNARNTPLTQHPKEEIVDFQKKMDGSCIYLKMEVKLISMYILTEYGTATEVVNHD
jgi:hypothetical protein